MNLLSCQEDLDLSLVNEMDTKVVVEGRITDEYKYQYLKLTLSDDYYSDEKPQIAMVDNIYITGSKEDKTYDLKLVDMSEGYYMSLVKFAGVIGSEYTLSFEYNEETYNATTQLDTVPQMDSVTCSYVYYNFLGISGYYLINMSGYEPEPTGDYYIFNLYINDTLYNDNINATAYTSDELINGEDFVEALIYSIPQEQITFDTNSIRLEMLSISKEEYNFIEAFNTETQGSGSIFSGPPADIPTNIVNMSSDNNGLGFFGTSAVSTVESVLYKQHDDSTNIVD